MTAHDRSAALLAAAAEAADAERTATAALEAARERTDAAMRAAVQADASWRVLATSTGLPLETVRSRVTDPHSRERAERQARRQQLRGLSSSEASAELGTSRAQLARMIKDGRLSYVKDGGVGRPRIATDRAWLAALQARGLEPGPATLRSLERERGDGRRGEEVGEDGDEG